MWPFNLSVRLLIVDLVGRYPTNYLIRREPILRHLSFDISTMRSIYVIRYYCPFPDTIPFRRAGCSRVTHPSATQSYHSSFRKNQKSSFVRLACVRHAASVHPEPGSNSLKFVSYPLSGYNQFQSLFCSILPRNFRFPELLFCVFSDANLRVPCFFRCLIFKVLVTCLFRRSRAAAPTRLSSARL